MTDNATETVRYVATVNVPGYLPMDDEPAVFETAAEAWWHLYHERCYAERDAPCDLCDDTMTHGPFGDCDDDSETAGELAQNARLSDRRRPFSAPDVVGTVYGPTPGYRGDHDLGLAYSVQVAEPELDTP
jgi:hypothetical protein